MPCLDPPFALVGPRTHTRGHGAICIAVLEGTLLPVRRCRSRLWACGQTVAATCFRGARGVKCPAVAASNGLTVQHPFRSCRASGGAAGGAPAAAVAAREVLRRGKLPGPEAADAHARPAHRLRERARETDFLERQRSARGAEKEFPRIPRHR